MNGNRSKHQKARSWRDRQAALAAFALEAFRSFDLDPILQQACLLVARGLRRPIAKVLQAMPDTEDLLLRAAVGLPPEVAIPGRTRVPGGSGSAAGYALSVAGPVLSEVSTETRFQPSEIVLRCGAKVTVNVVIPGQDGPFGCLEVDSLEDSPFSPEDIDFLRIYAALLGAAVERQRAGSKVQTLMRELQHRVKNDLQIITALLSLEGRQSDSPETRGRLESVASRVESLRLIHERLFAKGQVGQVDLADYLRELCEGRLRMHGLASGAAIRLDLRLNPVTTDHDRAVSIGLIVNEFITNSLTHAFPTGQGVITARLDQPTRRRLRLELADNGIGLPSEPPPGTRGMGRSLIRLMAEQAGGKAEWSSNGGTRLVLSVALP